MKIKTRILVVTLAALAMSATQGEACTNFIVGKKASVDGSVICSYNADDYGMFIGLAHYAAGTHKKGEMRDIVDWDTHKYIGKIPEAPVTYNVIGNINEFQVTIGETTYGGREEMVNPDGGIDYGSLIYLGLQRSRTAREAIKVMTTLAQTYGYCSEGETFTICDPNEAWIMEMQGKGKGEKGVVWVAQRIPDDAICGHANQSRIGKFNMKDKNNVMYAKDVVAFARKKGWFKGKDADFNWKMTYAKPVQVAMRDHYEGTPMAIDSTDIGGGIWQMPYRPTPLFYEVNGKKYFNERPTSTQQTGFTFVSQMRAWLPRKVGGVLWFGNDDGNMVAYTPIYCGNTVQPECYNTPGADALTFSMKNAYWVCNWVSNMVYPRYSQMFPSLKAVRDSLEQSYFARQKEVEDKAVAMASSDENAAVRYLNDYSNTVAQQMLARWKQLAFYLIVKYNDMTVKPEKDGKFLRTPEGIGVAVKRPGYPETYREQIVKQTGDRYEVPEK